MRSYALILGSMIALTACGETNSPAAPTLESTLTAAYAGAGGNVIERDQAFVPWNAQVYNPCQDETVQIDGETHLSYQLSTDGRGGLHEMFHTNSAAVRGLGLTTGAEYRVTGAEQSIWKQTSPGTWQSVHPATLHLVAGPDAASFFLRFNFFVRKEPGQPPEIHIGIIETTCH